MNKSLIFAALLVAPTMFAGPSIPGEQLVRNNSNLAIQVARAASPTDQLQSQISAWEIRVQQDPQNTGPLCIDFVNAILPGIELAKSSMIEALRIARRSVQPTDDLTREIARISEGLSLLVQLRDMTIKTLEKQQLQSSATALVRSATPTELLRPIPVKGIDGKGLKGNDTPNATPFGSPNKK